MNSPKEDEKMWVTRVSKGMKEILLRILAYSQLTYETSCTDAPGSFGVSLKQGAAVYCNAMPTAPEVGRFPGDAAAGHP